MVERAIYLHLNVLGVDHFHDAHRIVKHQAKLLTIVWGKKKNLLNTQHVYTERLIIVSTDLQL